MTTTPTDAPFTPTEKDVEFAYIDRRDFESQVSGGGRLPDEESQAEFARFLVRMKADAVREVAKYWAENPDEVDDETPRDSRNWLREYADAMEENVTSNS